MHLGLGATHSASERTGCLSCPSGWGKASSDTGLVSTSSMAPLVDNPELVAGEWRTAVGQLLPFEWSRCNRIY